MLSVSAKRSRSVLPAFAASSADRFAVIVL